MATQAGAEVCRGLLRVAEAAEGSELQNMVPAWFRPGSDVETGSRLMNSRNQAGTDLGLA
jgi:hypothetical protein